MPRKIYKCVSCGRYTLNKERCPLCGGNVRLAHPPRWSPTDRYAKYRIQIKTKLRKESLSTKG